MSEVRYDDDNDVLRIDIQSRMNSWGCEEYDGVVVFRNRNTDEIVGFLVYDFMSRYGSHRLPDFPDGIRIDFEKDVIPFVH
jgi:hypothetical protein